MNGKVPTGSHRGVTWDSRIPTDSHVQASLSSASVALHPSILATASPSSKVPVLSPMATEWIPTVSPLVVHGGDFILEGELSENWRAFPVFDTNAQCDELVGRQFVHREHGECEVTHWEVLTDPDCSTRRWLYFQNFREHPEQTWVRRDDSTGGQRWLVFSGCLGTQWIWAVGQCVFQRWWLEFKSKCAHTMSSSGRCHTSRNLKFVSCC